MAIGNSLQIEKRRSKAYFAPAWEAHFFQTWYMLAQKIPHRSRYHSTEKIAGQLVAFGKIGFSIARPVRSR